MKFKADICFLHAFMIGTCLWNSSRIVHIAKFPSIGLKFGTSIFQIRFEYLKHVQEAYFCYKMTNCSKEDYTEAQFSQIFPQVIYQ